jgi:hypothetical protein
MAPFPAMNAYIFRHSTGNAMFKNINAVIIDLDGTMLDTHRIFWSRLIVCGMIFPDANNASHGEIYGR